MKTSTPPATTLQLARPALSRVRGYTAWELGARLGTSPTRPISDFRAISRSGMCPRGAVQARDIGKAREPESWRPIFRSPGAAMSASFMRQTNPFVSGVCPRAHGLTCPFWTASAARPPSCSS
eukprot:411459-Prymnesium_polylepis.1